MDGYSRCVCLQYGRFRHHGYIVDLAFDISAPGSPGFYDGIGIPGGNAAFTNFNVVSLLPNPGTQMIDTDPFVVDSGTPGHDALLQLSSSGATFQANGSSTANVVQLANITFDVTGAAPQELMDLSSSKRNI